VNFSTFRERAETDYRGGAKYAEVRSAAEPQPTERGRSAGAVPPDVRRFSFLQKALKKIIREFRVQGFKFAVFI
jgi:hypothetical protein